jgi:DNA-directed RNA polymerase specialized sigma24 family protein
MLTKDLLDSIESRSTVLARRYYFLEKEDLMQAGYIFLMNLENTPLSNLQKHKAINYEYTDIERHALYQQKIEQNMSSFEIETDAIADSGTPEEIIEREQITDQLMNRLSRQEVLILEWLTEGRTFSEIGKLLGIKHDTVRRIAMRIMRKREEVENLDV